MKDRRPTVFACVTGAHIFILCALVFFMTARAANMDDYLELADFQYAGNPAGGSGETPVAAPKAASRAPTEIVDPNQPTDSSQATASRSGAVAAESSSDVGGGSGDGSGGGEGDGTGIDYLPMQKITQLPVISEKSVLERLPYPEMARRAGIMGKVFLELFVDSKGKIRRIAVLKEDPAGYGFAEAAVSAFDGCTFIPARLDGKPVAVRFRYPIRFNLN